MRPHQAVPSSSFADRFQHTANFSSCTAALRETGQLLTPTEIYSELDRFVLAKVPFSVANTARLRSLKAKLVGLLGK